MVIGSKVCKSCGNPTGRHPTADYCWDCKAKADTRNYKRQLKKTRMKKKNERVQTSEFINNKISNI